MGTIKRARHTGAVYCEDPVPQSYLDNDDLNFFDLVGSGVTSSRTAFESECKNITISEPEGAVDQENLLGTDANGFQNAVIHQNPYGLGSASGTMILTEDKNLETLVAGSGTALSSGKRYQLGDTTAGKTRSGVAMCFYQSGSAGQKYYGLNNAYVTRIGDIRIDDSGGHWEVDFEISCLPKDFYEDII